MTTELGYKGAQEPSSSTSDFNAHAFLIRQILSQISTATLVQIKAVTNAGGVSPVGYVDVLPLVNQRDGNNNAMPHGVVHSVPYFRLQGGTNAVILDPQVNDIGICIFADHDISAVKASKKQSNPGSKRRFDMADGLYIGGVLNGTPTQYIAFAAGGITVVSPTKVTVQAPAVQVDASGTITYNSPTITLNGTVSQGSGSYGGTTAWTGNMTIVGNVNITGSLTNNGKAVGSTHTHTAQGATAITTAPN